MIEDNLSAAYTDGHAWRTGPHAVYARMAEAAVSAVLGDRRLDGALAIDAGAGTGALAEVLASRGAGIRCFDASPAMASAGPRPACAADIRHLPVADGVATITGANFVLSHLADPAAALREMARVTAAGGTVLATAFPAGPDVPSHPLKQAIEAALVEAGYAPPPWYEILKTTGEARVGSASALHALAAEAGLTTIRTTTVLVTLAGLAPSAISAWRLGMAHVLPFISTLTAPARDRLHTSVLSAINATGQSDPVPVLVMAAQPRRS